MMAIRRRRSPQRVRFQPDASRGSVRSSRSSGRRTGDLGWYFLGSLNLDPRAIDINTEMGILVDDPVLAQRIFDWFASITVPANAWRVGLDEARKLFWESSSGRTTIEPAKTFGERVGDFFYSLIIPESQL